jgi:hypothetical protein
LVRIDNPDFLAEAVVTDVDKLTAENDGLICAYSF